jgi:hypothetical protein
MFSSYLEFRTINEVHKSSYAETKPEFKNHIPTDTTYILLSALFLYNMQ